MNDCPLISIIIPVYNLEKYIGLCLNVLVKQNIDKEQCEILCVNDGSTDNSENIILEYTKKYNNIILINKENGGVSSARNIGIDNAHGKWILFLDGDDLLLAKSFNKLFEQLDDKYDMFYFGTTSVEENFEQIHTDYSIDSYRTCEGKDMLVNKIYRKSIIDKNNIRFNEDVSYIEDTLFVLSYIRYVDKENTIDNFVYLYRQRATSVMHQKSKSSYFKKIYSVNKVCITIKNEYLPTIDKKSKIYKFEKNQLAEKSALAFYISPLSGIDKKEMVKLFKDNKMYPFSISWQQIRGMKSVKYKIKCFIVYMLRFKLIYYTFYDLVRFVLRKKLK